jgi:carboxyl-terminal processing protease
VNRAIAKGLGALVAVVALVAVFAGGIYVDQSFPDYVPNLRLGAQARGQVDQAPTAQALRLIQAYYYDPHLNYQALSSGSVKGMVQALGDPYTQYLSPDEYRQQQDQYAGRHEGMIGILVNYKDGYPIVAGVLPQSPAFRAGLMTDDVIVAIDGNDTHNVAQDRVSTLIRGPAGTSVMLRVRRADGEHDLRLSRANFQSPTVQSARLPGQILYLRAYQFGSSTRDEFDTQLKAGLPGARGVVLDLRDNGGGYVDAAAAMISRFVDSGEAFEERGRNGDVTRTDVDGNHPAAGLPVVVLVNENSASAAEIVSGSLQDRVGARLVGAKTYGKGSVQVDKRLDNGGDLHLTIAHWFLPNGRSIDKQGLTPDVSVALPDRTQMYDVVQPTRGYAGDAQLNQALSLLSATP